jgi:Na+/melibiose symporter-like transporter
VTTGRAKESYGISQTCAAHGKLAAMGQRVETLRKENKKEVLAYFIINGYFVLVIIYLLFLLYLNMTSTICMVYFIAYLVL